MTSDQVEPSLVQEPIAKTHSVRIWDWPVRLTHWSFALLLPAMWVTADSSQWGWHMRLGHVLLALIIFRILWGLIGTDTARFSSFVKGPGALLKYLRGGYPHKQHKGHTPLGALAVLALLGLTLAQVSMGLFAGDPFDGATGPLNSLVGVGTADFLTDTHEWFYWVVFGMVGLHITAVGLYGAFQAQNLIGPMVGGTGEKALSVADNSPAPWSRALGALAVSAGLAFWVYLGVPRPI
ncbi:cytochrome b/b6 domain-containing protein [uncultured Erythrobacter sp.]|uniref:cytochrome b/b6 domain-containing protein n=1 Tax=uncultured Erythrobacter sp. TaxID=263913 RepID=UPI00261F8564|nr:cytochrome b/b6 domain-containing protein [uncultured Erythrobacter sp.]